MAMGEMTYEEFLGERQRIFDGAWDAVRLEVIAAEVGRRDLLAQACTRRIARLYRLAMALRVTATLACFVTVAWPLHGGVFDLLWVRCATFCVVMGLWWLHWDVAKWIDERRYRLINAERRHTVLADLLQSILDKRQRPPPVRLVPMEPECSASDGFIVDDMADKRRGRA